MTELPPSFAFLFVVFFSLNSKMINLALLDTCWPFVIPFFSCRWLILTASTADRSSTAAVCSYSIHYCFDSYVVLSTKKPEPVARTLSYGGTTAIIRFTLNFPHKSNLQPRCPWETGSLIGESKGNVTPNDYL
ncbi:hypothetical protein DVH24_041547 [Malus domestica]|uniref:Uncharacterized protein n=1 Tax=Malus domestica TaxID=3750 RepID=A0A498IB37_MALDO|nr:hypothetical protein DVH24_041547 [Malus domestica]